MEHDYELIARPEVEEEFLNPLFQTPGLAPTPRPAFVALQSNPVWSPNEQQLSQTFQPTVKQEPVQGQRAGGNETEDEYSFAAIVQSAQGNQIDAPGVVQAYTAALEDHASELREEAARQKHGLRSIRLQELATELDAESATWRLLFTLHGIPTMDFPAGAGGPALNFGTTMRTQQTAARKIESDPELNRLARVVTWLEALAGKELDRQEAAAVKAGGAGANFLQREGLPLNTSDALDRHSTGRKVETVLQLDPDAATRQEKRWSEADAKNDERIAGRVWQLIRAGRMAQASVLCRQCGQPWRAASLGGQLEPGSILLGAAAVLADEAEDGEAMESMASEVDLDGHALRGMWRWTCYQAAEQIGEQNAFEAAAYGILGGNLKRVLPLCKTWHDQLWALSRTWLEAALDSELRPSNPTGEGSTTALVNTAAESTSRQAVVSEGSSLLRGPWPYHRSAQQAPTSWSDIHSSIGEAAVLTGKGLSFKDRQRLLQWQLILGPENDNYSRLLLDVLPTCLPESIGSEDAEQAGEQLDKMLRFAAHLGISFVDLGILPELHDTNVPPDFFNLQAKVNSLLLRYVEHILQRRLYSLIPAYTCRLQADSRHQICCSLLARLTVEGDFAAKQEAYEQLSQWFAAWAEQGRGDVHPAELDIIVQMVAQQSRWDLVAGPLLRSQTAGWLWLGPTTLVPAIQHTNTLLREFALGGPVMDAVFALLAILPPEFQSMMEGPASALDDLAWAGPLVEAGQVAEEEVEGIRDGLMQMHAWWTYFNLDREFREWSSRVEQLEDEEGSHVLWNEGEALLNSYLQFLSMGPDNAPPLLELISTAQVDHTEDMELKLWVSLGAVAEQASASYCLLSHADAVGLATRIQQQLEDASSQTDADALQLRASAAGKDDPGCTVEVSAIGGSAGALQRGTSLLSLVLKGDLPDAQAGLQVVNMEGAASAQAQMCKSVAYPAAATNAAQLRLMLLQMGGSMDVGAGLIPLVAGTDRSTAYKGLSPHFTPQQLRDLLELERQTVVASCLQQQQEEH